MFPALWSLISNCFLHCAGEVEGDDDHSPHQLFTEMDELRTDVDGVAEWKETARWVKFEEDVDEG